MVTVRIFLRNGTVLPDITCEEMSVSTSEITGRITRYSIKGIKGARPLHIDCNEIVAVYTMKKDEAPANG